MKNAIVTGSSRGIGKAIALRLARDGWGICVCCRERTDLVEDVVREIQSAGGRAVYAAADISDRAAVDALAAKAARELRPVELLVNNAGIAGQMQFQDMKPYGLYKKLWRNCSVLKSLLFQNTCLISMRKASSSENELFPKWKTFKLKEIG